MNKNIFKYCLLLFPLVLGSCGHFLEEVSQDEIKPSTVTDLEQLLLGDGYFNTEAQGSAGNFNAYCITDMFTDDIKCNGVSFTGLQYTYDAYDSQFSWKDEMFTLEGDGDNIQFWQLPYNGIGTCNVILDHLDKVNGDDVLREHIRGEVLVLRSWYFLHLVNFFGMPYNYGNPGENLGVPLQLTSGVTEERLYRNTVQEVYDQILKDMTQGYQLMKQNPVDKNSFRVGPLAAAAMLARVYLYMENWDKAINYADTVLRENSVLLDLNNLARTGDASVVKQLYHSSVYDPALSDEIIWGRPYGTSIYLRDVPIEGVAPYSISDSLQNLLFRGKSWTAIAEQGDVEDCRAIFFFGWQKRSTITYIYAPSKGTVPGFATCNNYQGIRTAEVYLIRAEAYARKNMENPNGEYVRKALVDLNVLRAHRLTAETSGRDLDITEANELFEAIQVERRLELCGETNNRWFDLRRWGMPEIIHMVGARESEMEPAVLTEKQYVLPIPEEALNRNGNLVQNIRK